MHHGSFALVHPVVNTHRNTISEHLNQKLIRHWGGCCTHLLDCHVSVGVVSESNQPHQVLGRGAQTHRPSKISSLSISIDIKTILFVSDWLDCTFPLAIHQNIQSHTNRGKCYQCSTYLHVWYTEVPTSFWTLDNLFLKLITVIIRKQWSSNNMLRQS